MNGAEEGKRHLAVRQHVPSLVCLGYVVVSTANVGFFCEVSKLGIKIHYRLIFVRQMLYSFYSTYRLSCIYCPWV